MTKKTKREVAKPYERTPKEREVLDELIAKIKARVEVPFIKSTSDEGNVTIRLDHEDERTGSGLLMAAFGTTSRVFAAGLFGQIAKGEMQGMRPVCPTLRIF